MKAGARFAAASALDMRRLRRPTSLLIASLLLANAASAQVLARPGWAGSGVTVETWWHRAVFYRLDPATFQDSNGDGRGDLAGVAQRLNYLQSLGADAIILAPAARHRCITCAFWSRSMPPAFSGVPTAATACSVSHAVGSRRALQASTSIASSSPVRSSRPICSTNCARLHPAFQVTAYCSRPRPTPRWRRSCNARCSSS